MKKRTRKNPVFTRFRAGLSGKVFVCVFVFLFVPVFASLSGCTPKEAETETFYASDAPEALLKELTDAYRETGKVLLDRGTAFFNETGSEWALIGLRASGALNENVRKAYLNGASETAASKDSDRMHASKSTDNARMILGITAAGGDPSKTGGKDLLRGISSLAYVKAQGNNGPIWALIALDAGRYEAADAAEEADRVTREALVSYILSVQRPDGGYSMMNGESDVDLTAMAVQALAPYMDDPEVRAAVERALTHLGERQEADGGFEGYNARTSESISQVIIALRYAGVDPLTDGRFIKNGRTLFDALLSFRTEDGFLHEKKDGTPNGMATDQAFLALASLFLPGGRIYAFSAG